MTTAAYNHLMTAKKFTKSGKENIKIWFNGIDVKLRKGRKRFSVTSLKRAFDKAARTKTDNTKKWVEDQYGEFMYSYPECFKLIGNEYWATMDLFDSIVPDMLKRKCAILSWLMGEEDWRSHFIEFIYIRCDPKFKCIDCIVKGGRAMNLYGRNANYKQHAVEDGDDTIFALFCVDFGSPAETLLKGVFNKHFEKPKKSESGTKLGKEHYFVPNVKTSNDFYAAMYQVADVYTDALNEADLLIDSWCPNDFEADNLESMNAFILACMPWARVQKVKA